MRSSKGIKLKESSSIANCIMSRILKYDFRLATYKVEVPGTLIRKDFFMSSSILISRMCEFMLKVIFCVKRLWKRYYTVVQAYKNKFSIGQLSILTSLQFILKNYPFSKAHEAWHKRDWKGKFLNSSKLNPQLHRY